MLSDLFAALTRAVEGTPAVAMAAAVAAAGGAVIHLVQKATLVLVAEQLANRAERVVAVHLVLVVRK